MTELRVQILHALEDCGTREDSARHTWDSLADAVMAVVGPVVAERDKFAAAIAETVVRLHDAGYQGSLVDSVTRLIEERDQALAAASDARDEAYAAREDLALGDSRLAEREAERDQARVDRDTFEDRWRQHGRSLLQRRRELELVLWLHAEAVWQRDVHKANSAELFDEAFARGQQRDEAQQPASDNEPDQRLSDDNLYQAVLWRVGFREDGELTAGGSAGNDLAHERADVVIRFLAVVAKSSWPEGLLPAGGDDHAQR